MWEKLKACWKYVVVIIGLIAAFVGGLATAFALKNGASGWVGNLFGGRKSSDSNGSTGLAEGLGGLTANQHSAELRIADIKATSNIIDESSKRLESNNTESGRIIDSAENRLNRLDDILGIPKDN